MSRKLFLAIASAALVAGQSASAQITVGTGDNGNVFPFGQYGDGATYEQLYFASSFGALPIFINSLTFGAFTGNPSNQFDGQTFSIYLSTNNAFGTDPNANLGADVALFFQGVITGSANQTINGNTFAYDPTAGNLLMEVVVTGTRPAGTGAFESDDSGTQMERLYQSAGDGAFSVDNTGLVTTFGLGSAPVTTPEPATLGLLGLGLAGLFGVKRRIHRGARQS